MFVSGFSKIVLFLSELDLAYTRGKKLLLWV